MAIRSAEPAPWLPALADALAEALPRLLGEAPDPRLAGLIRAMTAALERGELELDLDDPAPAGLDPADWPEGIRRALEASALTRPPEGPLLVEGGRIAWRRWWEQRQRQLASLIARAACPPAWGALDLDGSPDAAEEAGLDPDQLRAVTALDRHRLVLLQGGPGTGKTSTVSRMLKRQLQLRPGLRIHLAAPTGKAAARLRAASGEAHPCTTLHRLLESRGDGFGRNRHHPLALDLLVVDEVSMVDLALMDALLEALPEPCSLVLVGDPAQLPPIAAGAPLLDLQQDGARQALGPALITLRTVHRNAGAIAAVAASLRQASTALRQNAPALEADPLVAIRPDLERLGPGDNLRWQQLPAGPPPPPVLERLADHQRRLADLAQACSGGESDPAAERELLAERDRLLVLTPRRQGRWSVEAIHRALLGESWADPFRWPTGTPAICCRNLPELGLANGDVGVLLGPDPQDGERRLLFGDPTAQGLRVHPAQLAGGLEPALALTVHKAQGSEARELIVLLPAGEPRDPRLLYTALTRAREQALLISTKGAPSLA
ncbi:MAG: ATP-dependent RecD-like DNA helicase [Cyanobium sp.]